MKTNRPADPAVCTWRSPIGVLRVVATTQGIREIAFDDAPDTAPSPSNLEEGEAAEAIAQLRQYFAGERKVFSLRLDFTLLSPFAAAVLKRLMDVPYGRCVTYGELAARLGRPGAARAVGRAMALNPFLIVVPCHRVVGANGKLTGYSGGEGIVTKEWLLSFERRGAEGEV